MPKIPQKFPSWMGKFVEYAKGVEKRREVKNALDIFLEVATKQWPGFVEHNQAETKQKAPKKKRKPDPIKMLGKAMDVVVDRMQEVSDNDVLLKEYKEQVIQTIPDQIRPIFQEEGVHANVNNLLEQAHSDLAQLATATQNISNNLQMLQLFPMKQEVDQASSVIHRVTESLEKIRQPFSDVGDGDGGDDDDERDGY